MDKTTAILNSLQAETTEAWAQFNKITGEFTGVFQKVDVTKLNQEYYDYVAIEINLDTQRIEGTKNNFKIVIYANHLFRASYSSMKETANQILKDGRAFNADKDILDIQKTIDLIK